VTTVLLVRHGLTAATGHTLSGWTPGIPLDDRGHAQARALGTRLARLPLDAIVTSPLDRCRQTAEAVAAARDGRGPEIRQDGRLGECRYGDWTGKPLRKLVKEPLWRVVQAHPSAVRFPGPGGESMLDAQHRAVAAVREWNATLGPGATYLICSHADVIKGIIADCLGLHLDLSQRIQADPCSLTVIRYTPLRPFLLRMNDTGGIEDLMPRAAGERESEHAAKNPGKNADGKGQRGESDAVVGGGAGANPDSVPAQAQTGARTGARTGTQTGAPAVREPSADARG
jgi:probable phosphomutase (TIGR03848 family)